jgi:hypothetical protein
MVKNLLFCGIICLLATGCAFTRTETPVHFSPVINQPLSAQKKAALVVADFTDSRDVLDKYVLLHKSNGFGQVMAGAYVTKEPVADILKNGIEQVLKTNGFFGGILKYELHGDLKSFGGQEFQGFWKDSVKVEIAVHFELVDKNSGQSVWNNTVIGHTTETFSIGGNNTYGQAFSDSATDLAKNLIADKTFRSFFEQ